MRRVFRTPLMWMVIGECAVVGALVLIAWHAMAGGSLGAAVPLFQPPIAASPADRTLPAASPPIPGRNSRGPVPALNVGVGFWRVRLGTLNRDEAAFEALEWRITHAAMNVARDYLETVVLPAVRRAERSGA